jgi:hypothetical protein
VARLGERITSANERLTKNELTMKEEQMRSSEECREHHRAEYLRKLDEAREHYKR